MTAPATDADLARLVELEAAATKAPWTAEHEVDKAGFMLPRLWIIMGGAPCAYDFDRQEDTSLVAESRNLLPAILARLTLAEAERDEARIALWGRGEPCRLCGGACDALAADPGAWPVGLCHSSDPGRTKPHHVRCVSDRMRRAEKAEAERDAAVAVADAAREYVEKSAAFSALDMALCAALGSSREVDPRMVAARFDVNEAFAILDAALAALGAK